MVAFLTLTAVLFVFPATNTPQRVDAVVVLGGSGDRLGKGLALVREGYAPVLLVSDHQEAPCPPDTRRYRVVCFNPDPATTQGEAEDVGRMASADHWDRLLVVSSIPQTTRGAHPNRPLLPRDGALRPGQPGRDRRMDLRPGLRVGSTGQVAHASAVLLDPMRGRGGAESAVAGPGRLEIKTANETGETR